ncbi:hypothetical protein CHS0354_022581 [Potamilus streckersoni]|uniref:Uncharacterized protein n=1 Tax=Potamilus streckersoni TaxID=2493646 RepID=A0AAE0VW58_9BIVA|nr:hypothetical protein CHS0354_022581 [Potamilus streckersoni]
MCMYVLYVFDYVYVISFEYSPNFSFVHTSINRHNDSMIKMRSSKELHHFNCLISGDSVIKMRSSKELQHFNCLISGDSVIKMRSSKELQHFNCLISGDSVMKMRASKELYHNCFISST